MLAGLIAPHDPIYLDTSVRFLAPLANMVYPLGTDELGRDTLSRLLHGGRISLVVGLVAMVATVFTGALVGIIAGYYGKWIDNLIMRLVDTLLCFPQVFLLLVVAAFVRPTLSRPRVVERDRGGERRYSRRSRTGSPRARRDGCPRRERAAAPQAGAEPDAGDGGAVRRCPEPR